MKKIVLVGFGGHAKSIVDSIESKNEYEIIGFIDKDEKKKIAYRGYGVVGTDQDAEHIFLQGVKQAVLAIGMVSSQTKRSEIYNYYKKIGFKFPRIIDRTAVIASDCKIGEGVFVGKNAIINANAVVGDMTIINTNAIIEHDANIGRFSHVAVAATICGGARIGEDCLIGANSTILQEIVIGDEVQVGAGAVVTKNVSDGELVVGVPARKMDK